MNNIRKLIATAQRRFSSFLDIPEDADPSIRYNVLKRNILVLMFIITLLPLCIMAFLNYHQYQGTLRSELFSPSRMLLNKARHSFELYFRERIAALNFVASAYSFENLSNAAILHSLYHTMRKEYVDVVDIGLIDSDGNQITYAGPYNLQGKNYKDQHWFNEVKVRGSYISDVFLGYRKFPHIAIAIQRLDETGRQ